jgi:hypothetical protein
MDRPHAQAYSRGVGRLTAAGVILALLAVVASASGGAPSAPVHAAKQLPLEHFKCYTVKPQAGFKRRTVKLSDQFRDSEARVLEARTLCTPAKKNKEPFRNGRAHLQCFRIAAPTFQAVRVEVTNQFGSLQMTVVQPVSLCAPSIKSKPGVKPVPLKPVQRIDHYVCYSIDPAGQGTPSTLSRTVNLVDQFGRERVTVATAVQLCAPVSKDGGRVFDKETHLLCYRIRHAAGPAPVSHKVRVKNQFGAALETVVKPATLCVPSQKKLL